jgi:hypothetical protein
MSYGVSEVAMRNCTETAQLGAKLSGPLIGRRVSNFPSTRIAESEQLRSSATSSTLSAISGSKGSFECKMLRLNSQSLRNGI